MVLDVGKSLSKLTLFAPDGRMIGHCKRANERIDSGSYPSLDTAGIEDFIEKSLRGFALLAEIGHIIPVGHGAAAAIIEGEQLAAPRSITSMRSPSPFEPLTIRSGIRLLRPDRLLCPADSISVRSFTFWKPSSRPC